MTMMWKLLEPGALDRMGWIPNFLSDDDPRPAKEQFDENYAHGGGWNPLSNWERVTPDSYKIRYPGDPAISPISQAQLRDETICVYPYAWVGIFQPDGSFEIARLD